MRVPVVPPNGSEPATTEHPALAPGLHKPTSHASKPSAKFISDFATAIRAGARPTAAAEWLGVPKRTYRAWLKRLGEPYDTLRAERAKALAHVEVRLSLEAAKRNPEARLRALRDELATSPRPYTQTGRTLVSKALPYLVERVADPSIPDDALSLVEQAARGWRSDVLNDLGGLDAVTAARRALLDAATGTLILLHSLDAAVFRLAAERGLVSRKHRKAFALVSDRMRVADGLARQLQVLGLDREPQKVQPLHEYVAARYGDSVPDAPRPDEGAPPSHDLSPAPDPGARPAEESHERPVAETTRLEASEQVE